LPYDLERRLKHSSDRATTELTSVQNECRLAGQSAVMRPKEILDYNRHTLNDLPATQPARKVLKHYADNLRVLTDPDKAYGTATAHQIECFLLVGPGVVRSSIRGLQYEGPASALSR